MTTQPLSDVSLLRGIKLAHKVSPAMTKCLPRNVYGMATVLIGVLTAQFAGPTANGQETNRIETLRQLQAKLAAHLGQFRFAGSLWGVKIVSLDSGETLFEDHADRLMSPASNCKLYTAALALERLGGDYRIATPIYATAKVIGSGTIAGDLIIAGRGDPSWNTRRLGTNFWEIFEPFVAALAKAGVRRVTGDLVADATFFHGEPTGSGWMIDDLQAGEAGEVSALTLNDNVAQARVTPGPFNGAPCGLTFLQPGTDLVFSNGAVTVSSNSTSHLEDYCPPGTRTVYVFGRLPLGSTNEEILDIPVAQPAGWFAAALKQALARHGIEVSGKARSFAWPQSSSLGPTEVKLGEVLSPPLREVIRGFMKPSQNLETDLLLAHVGEMTRSSNASPWQTSEEAGLAALHKFLLESDLPAAEVHFDEGSGLSDHNLTTANATVALLKFMAKHREAEAFIDSLPVAGVDGTLRRRMKNTAAAGNVRAKTGTLRWANSLSGYVTSAAGEKLAFSLMLNRYVAPPGNDRRDELDRIAVMLAEFAGYSTNDFMSLKDACAPFGRLLLTQLVAAPFPHPARANGYTYHSKFYSAQEHYSDSTVAIFVPKDFRESERVDLVVHFHGWNHTVPGTLSEYKLIEQFAASGKNAVLVVPQGPLNVPDSFGGKLEDTNGFGRFIGEVTEVLKNGVLTQTNFEVGNIILSGHSGGYHVMAAIVDHGGLSKEIREVWLFDALYAGTQNFLAWQQKQNGRLLNIYTDHGGTRQETEDLMKTLKTSGVSFFVSEDNEVEGDNLRTNRIIFLHSDLPHNDVVAKRGTFGEFLRTCCFQDQ